MTCQNCGQTNESEQNYCRNCGAPLLQPQPYQQPRAAQPKPYGWASPSSPLHNIGGETDQPRAVEPLPPAPAMPFAPSSFAYAPPNSLGYRCPRCASTAAPIARKKISDNGWIVFVLMLIFCFPLFWIGLLMRDEYRVCPTCLLRLD